MKPILWEWHGLRIHAYGLFLLLAFLSAVWLAGRRAAARGLDAGQLAGWAPWALAWGLVGARLGFVLLHWDRFRDAWEEIPAIWHGGLVLQAGWIAGGAYLCAAARRAGWPLRILGDAAAPALALGEAVGRVGCLLNGCCFGRPTSCPLGVRFGPLSEAGRRFAGEALHPTQLYLAVGLILLLFLLLAEERRRAGVHPGRTLGLYLVGSMALRFGVDFLRVYEPSVRWLGLAHSQWVAALGLLVGLAILWKPASRGG
jgi:phosphatidylglycerol:prolipoprotein diacylglycerol transferase